MVGPTIVQSGDRIDNHNKKKVGVLGMYNLPLIEWTRELVTDSSHPGETLMPPTGAGGEDKRQLATDKTITANAFHEWDPGLGVGVSTDVAAGKEVPILPFNMNRGAYCRNIQFVDPGGNVEPETPVCTSSGSSGALQVVTELTFETGTSSGGFEFQVNTMGTNAAAGTYMLDFLRTVAIMPYYLADPSAAVTEVVYIL